MLVAAARPGLPFALSRQAPVARICVVEAIALVSLAAIYVSSHWVQTAAQTRGAPDSVPDVSRTEPPKANPSPVASHLPNFLTNEDVNEISGSGLATATLVRLISRMPHRFTVDPQ